jgi:hypothetical protein
MRETVPPIPCTATTALYRAIAEPESTNVLVPAHFMGATTTPRWLASMGRRLGNPGSTRRRRAVGQASGPRCFGASIAHSIDLYARC